MFTLMPLFHDLNKIGDGTTFIEGYAKILDVNKIKYEYIRYDSSLNFWDKIASNKFFVARWRGSDKDLSLLHAILPEIERIGVKALPSFNTVYHCGDKLRLAVFYEANKINSPKTHIFWTYEDFSAWLKENSSSWPLIAKLIQGAGSKNVIKVNNILESKKLARSLFSKGVKHGMMEEATYGSLQWIPKFLSSPQSNSAELKQRVKNFFFEKSIKRENTCLILQEYLPNDYDTRVTVIGDRAFAFRRFNRENDFRASGSGKIDYNPKYIDERMIEMALNISRTYDYQTMAYDFLYDLEGNPSIIEMNHTYVDKAVSECPVFWKADGSTVENNGRFPQFWQLVDILDDSNLKHF